MSTLEVNKLAPLADNGTVTLGDSGDTVTIPSGVTITNNGTQTGFGGTNTPAFEAYLSANQSVTSGTATKLQSNTEVFDTDSAYDNSSNYRFTVPSGKAGTYYFYTHIVLNQEETYLGYGDIRFYKNGSSIRKNSFENILGTNDSYMKFMPVSLDMTLPLVAGDYIEVYGVVGAFGGGSTHRFYSTNNESYFGGYKIIGA